MFTFEKRESSLCNEKESLMALVCAAVVRFARTAGLDIGFHAIPNGRRGPIQTDAELGQFRSLGCVRQSTADAAFLWDWAPIGTAVVVTVCLPRHRPGQFSGSGPRPPHLDPIGRGCVVAVGSFSVIRELGCKRTSEPFRFRPRL
ncbi:MAG: L,D-transpeptidase [Actinomycetota bacterium]